MRLWMFSYLLGWWPGSSGTSCATVFVRSRAIRQLVAPCVTRLPHVRRKRARSRSLLGNETKPAKFAQQSCCTILGGVCWVHAASCEVSSVSCRSCRDAQPSRARAVLLALQEAIELCRAAFLREQEARVERAMASMKETWRGVARARLVAAVEAMSKAPPPPPASCAISRAAREVAV